LIGWVVGSGVQKVFKQCLVTFWTLQNRISKPKKPFLRWHSFCLYTGMGRRTAQLFDLMFKSIIKDASHPAIVHLINGICQNQNLPEFE
jgi:hypothetical protein